MIGAIFVLLLSVLHVVLISPSFGMLNKLVYLVQSISTFDICAGLPAQSNI